MSTNELPTDSVEMVRAIRQRHYEETKNMTPDEKWEYDRCKVAAFERLQQILNPADYDFSWLKEPLRSNN